MNEEKLFHEALTKSPSERTTFLDEACAGRPELRASVEALLAAHELPGTPPADLDMTIESEPNKQDDGVTGQDTPPSGQDAFFSDATMEFRPDSEPGVVLAGQYMLEHKLGEGGMGEVWVAMQSEPIRRRVAVKVIKTGMDFKGMCARFEQQRQALAAMDHPNIARVLDGGMTPSGHPFFVMELVDGRPLTKYSDDHKMTTKERLELFVAICQAVQHAHQKGILHRDLRPANILVTRSDGKAFPKVIDFGVANAVGGRFTEETFAAQFGAMVGKVDYMSPEQTGYSGTDVDTRADIYSLGVILYELLTGIRPFDAARLKKAGFSEMIRIIGEESPPKPSTRLSTDKSLSTQAAVRSTKPKMLIALLRRDLDWVVMKCLEKQRDRRYQTANGLVRDVQRYLANEPVEARPPSAGYRLRKYMKRNKGMVVAASLVLLILVGGIIGTALGWIEAKRQASLAEEYRRQADSDQKTMLKQTPGEQPVREPVPRNLGADGHGKPAEPSKKLVEDPPAKVPVEAKKVNAENEIAESVREFIQDRLLNQTDVTMQSGALLQDGVQNAKAKNPVIKELLDRAAAELTEEKIDKNFPEQPLVQAELLHIWGMAYMGIGDYEPAIACLKRAAALSESNLGAEESRTIRSMRYLTAAYLFNRQTELALPLAEKTLQLAEEKHGPSHRETIAAMHNLAWAYRTANKLNEAMQLGEKTLTLAKTEFGPDHRDTLTCMHNLANVYRFQGNLNKAIPLFEETLKKQRTKLEPDHPNTLITIENLARTYQKARRPNNPSPLWDKVIPLMEEAFQRRKAMFGLEDAGTLDSINLLAVACWSAKRLDKSVPLFEESLKAHEAKFGRDHVATMRAVANLGVNYMDADRLPEAIPLLEEAHAASKKHDELRWVGRQLLNGYVKAKKTKQASELIKEQLAEAREQLPKDSPQMAGALALMAMAMLQAEAYAEAETLLRESLAIREKELPDSWLTFNAKSMLGGALLGQKKYKEAEPLLFKGYEGIKLREKTIPPKGKVRVTEAEGRLAQLFEATRKKTETKLKGKLDDTKRTEPHELKLKAGEAVIIEMSSKEFDTFLGLEDAQGNKLAANDDIDLEAKNLNSRLLFFPKQDGTYRVIATSYQQTGQGEYEIVIRRFSEKK